MKWWDHMKLLLMIRVLSMVRGVVLYWRPQIASAASGKNGGIEGTVYIRTAFNHSTQRHMNVQDRTPEILDRATACGPHGLFADHSTQEPNGFCANDIRTTTKVCLRSLRAYRL